MSAMVYPEAEFCLRDLHNFNEALEVALIENNPEAARELLDLDAMPQVRDDNSAILLARVLRYYTGRDATLEEVLGPRAREGGLRSLLHVAVSEGYTGIVRLLLEWGADPNDSDELQRTALHMAAARNQRDIALLLLEYGADARGRHCSGKTALHFACEGTDDDELVGLLLDRGLAVNDADLIHRNTPLHLASWNGRTKVAQLLMERGANLTARNNQGCTPLHFGARSARLLDLFLERDVDMKSVDARGLTPLSWLDRHQIGEGRRIIARLIKDQELEGIPIDEENIRCIESQVIWRQARNQCKVELDRMRTTPCYRDLKCLDVLVSSVSQLAMHMKNRRLSYTLTTLHFEDYFRNYGSELQEKIAKAKEAKAHEHRAIHFVHRALGGRMPHAVVAKIAGYLSNKDVKFR